MAQTRDLIRECTNPHCEFRYPVPENTDLGIECPRCQHPTIVVAQAGDDPGWNPRDPIAASGPPLEALLDNIRSTYNVGSMFRTSDGAGLQHLHLCGVTPTPEHPKIPKTALGAEFSIPWTYHPNSVKAALECKAKGMRLWALEVGPQAVSLFEATQEISGAPILLIVGNEVSGVDTGLLELCDKRVWIPMQGYKRSLNVATAFSVMVYFLRYAAALPRPSHQT